MPTYNNIVFLEENTYDFLLEVVFLPQADLGNIHNNSNNIACNYIYFNYFSWNETTVWKLHTTYTMQIFIMNMALYITHIDKQILAKNFPSILECINHNKELFSNNRTAFTILKDPLNWNYIECKKIKSFMTSVSSSKYLFSYWFK